MVFRIRKDKLNLVHTVPILYLAQISVLGFATVVEYKLRNSSLPKFVHPQTSYLSGPKNILKMLF